MQLLHQLLLISLTTLPDALTLPDQKDHLLRKTN